MDLVKRSTAKARELRPLNFFITETFELAEKHCEDAIKRGKQPFTMAIKDSFAVKDVRKTCASKMLANYTPDYTATCVQRLLDNGGCLVGKSNMDEFAMGSTSTTGHFGHVLHSCYAKQKPPGLGSDFRVAGGSSGGCAVSVGAEVVEMALGTDTGGSVRYPAAINGIYGFKPSYGRLSRHGLVPLANSLDTPSIFTNSISNCRRFYVYMKGNDPMDSTSLPNDVDLKKEKRRDVQSVKDLVVGVPKYKRTNLLSADAHRVWEAAIAQFKADGATIREVHLPNMEYAIECYTIIVCADFASNMARYDGIRYGHRTEMKPSITHLEHITTNRTEGFSQAVKRRIFAGNYFLLQENYKQFVEQAAKVRRLIQQDYHEAFNQVDCILAPVSRHSAPMFSEVAQRSREDQWLDDYYNLHVNLSGLPSIAIPYGHCSQGLPLGVQLVGPYLEDERLLDMAEMLKNRKL